jgi:pyruvate formate lyase activating enzyme
VFCLRALLQDPAWSLQGSRGGTLLVPWGYVGCIQLRRDRKKPFFHAHPGALAYSFGMLGCDLHCGYCQNWVTSQALRDPAAVAGPMRVTPAELLHDVLRQGGRITDRPFIPLMSSQSDLLVLDF